MSSTLPSCSKCQQEFWPTINQRSSFCPECARTEAPVELEPSDQDTGVKSTLPQPPGVSGNVVSVRPRELPGLPLPGNHAPEKERTASAFDRLRGKRSPQMMFTCPACMTLLALKPEFQMAGNALPCPYCATAILPPKLFVPEGAPKKKTSNVWKVGEQKDRNKIYRPPRDNANHVFLKARS